MKSPLPWWLGVPVLGAAVVIAVVRGLDDLLTWVLILVAVLLIGWAWLRQHRRERHESSGQTDAGR